jgi:hypothetical protein
MTAEELEIKRNEVKDDDRADSSVVRPVGGRVLGPKEPQTVSAPDSVCRDRGESAAPALENEVKDDDTDTAMCGGDNLLDDAANTVTLGVVPALKRNKETNDARVEQGLLVGNGGDCPGSDSVHSDRPVHPVGSALERAREAHGGAYDDPKNSAFALMATRRAVDYILEHLEGVDTRAGVAWKEHATLVRRVNLWRDVVRKLEHAALHDDTSQQFSDVWQRLDALEAAQKPTPTDGDPT